MPAPASTPPNQPERWRRQIGARLRHLRQGAELTQIDLAQRLGISRRKLIQIETGEADLTLTEALAAAYALGVTVQALIPEDRRRRRGPRIPVMLPRPALAFLKDFCAQHRLGKPAQLVRAALDEMIRTHRPPSRRSLEDTRVVRKRTASAPHGRLEIGVDEGLFEATQALADRLNVTAVVLVMALISEVVTGQRGAPFFWVQKIKTTNERLSGRSSGRPTSASERASAD